MDLRILILSSRLNFVRVLVAVGFVCSLGHSSTSIGLPGPTPGPITRIKPECNVCDKQCRILSDYMTHCRTHRHDNNIRFSCCIPGCIRTFYTYNGLFSHISRNHNDCEQSNESKLTQVRYSGINVQCMLTVCKHICSDLKELMSHLRDHIDSGLMIPCPFDPCGKQFDKKSSFSSHVSRYHKNYSIADVSEAFVSNYNVQVSDTTASEYNTNYTIDNVDSISCDLQDTDDECDDCREVTKTINTYSEAEYTKKHCTIFN